MVATAPTNNPVIHQSFYKDKSSPTTIIMAVEDAKYIREKVMAHNKWFEECIPMIASETLMSPLAKEMLISDFADRYAEGLPGKRHYQRNIYVEQVELKAMELAKKIFNAEFADPRP